MQYSDDNRGPLEEAARSILEAFDRLGLSRLGAGDLAAHAKNGALAEADLANLVQTGYLRQNVGAYERSEAGRLEVAGPTDLTLLSRSGCHLCAEAVRQIEPLAALFKLRLRVVDIDTDAALRARYDTHIPVLFLGSRELARHAIDSQRLRAELSQARSPR